MKNKDFYKIVFPKLGHFWLDSGLIGFIKMLKKINMPNVSVKIMGNDLVLSGPEEDLQLFIENAYELLINNYYNLSTKKQKEDISLYNFYYDTKENKFEMFPKRKAVGISEMIYNKAPRPTGDIIKWVKKEKKEFQIRNRVVKKNRGVLPSKYAYLQDRLEEFLDSNMLDVTTSGLLLDGPNVVKPKVKIQVKGGRIKGTCYLCGNETHILEEINQTVFPLITGYSGVLSFNPGSGKPEKVCWKCALLGKFVPSNGFYMYQGENIFIFLPYAFSLEKMYKTSELLQTITFDDPNHYRNFEHSLGGYFQHPFEVIFTFLYTLYEKFAMSLKSDEVGINEFKLNEASVDYFIIHAKNEGNTFATKMIWPFRETDYFYKLIQEIETRTQTKIKESLALLVDYLQPKSENKTLLRNRVCERMLKKQSILELVEKHIFCTEISFLKPLMDMLMAYELLIREDDDMFQDVQGVAVKLGRSVGMAVGHSTYGKKGDLFQLRKSRRKVDFLEQLNRLQFKLGSEFNVPSDVYEGKLTDENFTEFKQFCMVSALNSYNYAKTINK